MAKRLFTSRQNEVAELFAAGKSRREIAAALSISVDAVKQRLTRARKRNAQRYAKALAQPSTCGSSGGARPHRIVPIQFRPPMPQNSLADD